MTIPVNAVNGIGPKTVEYLKARRITTVEALVKRGAAVLEAAPGFSPGRAANVLKVANSVLDGTYIQKKTKPKSSAKPASSAKPKSKVKAKSDKKDKKDKKKDKDKKSKNKKDKKSKKDKKKDKKKNKKNKK